MNHQHGNLIAILILFLCSCGSSTQSELAEEFTGFVDLDEDESLISRTSDSEFKNEVKMIEEDYGLRIYTIKEGGEYSFIASMASKKELPSEATTYFEESFEFSDDNSKVTLVIGAGQGFDPTVVSFQVSTDNITFQSDTTAYVANGLNGNVKYDRLNEIVKSLSEPQSIEVPSLVVGQFAGSKEDINGFKLFWKELYDILTNGNGSLSDVSSKSVRISNSHDGSDFEIPGAQSEAAFDECLIDLVGAPSRGYAFVNKFDRYLQNNPVTRVDDVTKLGFIEFSKVDGDWKVVKLVKGSDLKINEVLEGYHVARGTWKDVTWDTDAPIITFETATSNGEESQLLAFRIDQSVIDLSDNGLFTSSDELPPEYTLKDDVMGKQYTIHYNKTTVELFIDEDEIEKEEVWRLIKYYTN